MNPTDDDLIDRIYESSFIPESWPAVLDALASVISAPGGVMYVYKNPCDVGLWVASEKTRERTRLLLEEKWLEKGQFVPRVHDVSMRHQGFLSDEDLFTPDEIAREPIYRDFWGPRGGGWITLTDFPATNSDRIFFAFVRKGKQGPVERELLTKIDALRPHLARSATLAVQMQLAEAQSIGATMQMIGLPAFVLDPAGRVLAANQLIEGLTDILQWRAWDRVALKDRAANAMLNAAINGLANDHAPSTRSFPVRSTQSEDTLVGHVIPIRGNARDIFVRCAAILVLTPLGATYAPTVELIRSLFDLTPAEARVAQDLASGQSVEDISKTNMISHNTVRTHIRRVLEKTGCNRQAEVVALLTGVGRCGGLIA